MYPYNAFNSGPSDTEIMFWLLFGVLWFVTCWVAGFVAEEKGRSYFGWSMCSLFLSPVVALLGLCALPVKERELAPAGHYAPKPKSPDISQKFSA